MNCNMPTYTLFDGIDENSVTLVFRDWKYGQYAIIGETILDWVLKEHIALPCIVRLHRLKLEYRTLDKLDEVLQSLRRVHLNDYIKIRYWSVDHHDIVLRLEEYGIQDI